MDTPSKKITLTSANLSEERLIELRRIFPDVFSEKKIDWDKLRTVLGDEVDHRVEKFQFTWAGKSDAIKNVLIPSKATLCPAPKESVAFDTSENLFIEGDNLEVLKLLQKGYFEKIKMIYIDPPYNTGGDFVYKDDFAAPVKNYLEQTGQIDSEGNKLSTNKETSGRFHSDWLSMMYPRLKLAWNLLRDDGVIFVSIDDHEAHHLRMVMDGIFGEESFAAQFVWIKKRKASNLDAGVRGITEYVICYFKKRKFGLVSSLDPVEQEKPYPFYNSGNKRKVLRFPGNCVRVEAEDKKYSAGNYPDKKTLVRLLNDIVIKDGLVVDEFELEGEWRYSQSFVNELLASKQKIVLKGDKLKPYWINSDPERLKFVRTLWNDESYHVGTNEDANQEQFSILGGNVFSNPKPVALIKHMVEISTGKDDLVLDFFAGSGTAAHAVLKQNQEDGGNRKFILVQLPEATDVEGEAYRSGYKTIADISKERIRRVINGYGENPQPIDTGFKVFKLGESNYPENQFEFDPEKSEEENKKAFEDYLKRAKQSKLIDDIDETSIIYENIVKEGFSLNAKVQESVVGKNKIYTVTDGERNFLICLDRQIDDVTVRNMMDWDKGVTFICFDNALNDTAKANLGLHVELKTI